MKRSRKHIRILTLMITSQVLLTAFVFQWLRSQYHDESERLADELLTTYAETQDQLIDTLLFKNYVNPVLAQNRGEKAITIAIEDSLRRDSISPGEREIEGQLSLNRNGGAVMIRMNHSGDSLSQLSDTFSLRKVNNDFLLRSIRMIVRHSEDSGRSSAVIHNLNIKPDTAAFSQNFNKKLAFKGMKFNLHWVHGKAPVRHPGAGVIYINPGNPFSLPGVTVAAYQGYILKNILPQILFGITLILITAIAFWLAFRSLREHIIFNEMRNEFISNMTHELKTPVATIGIALESLGKYNMKDKPEVMEEYLRLASSETRRLEDLISRVLDHSVLEENAATENMAVADINPVLQEITGIMRSRFEEGNIELQTAEEKLNILCDPLLLKGVIINIVDNSIKYCDKTPVIKIKSERELENAVITVSDNGPGIPFEYQTKIFEKFFRLPTGNIHNVKGYGLGLSFAALVVKLHKGSISVRNNDEGCSFIIRLPLA